MIAMLVLIKRKRGEGILSKYVKHEGKWVFIAFVLPLFFKWFKYFQIKKEGKG